MDYSRIVVFKKPGHKEVYLIEESAEPLIAFGRGMITATVLYHTDRHVKPGTSYLLPKDRIESEGVIL